MCILMELERERERSVYEGREAHRWGCFCFDDCVWDDIVIAMKKTRSREDGVGGLPRGLDGSHAPGHVILQCHVGQWAALIGILERLNARLADGRLVHAVPRGPRGKLTAGNKAGKVARSSRIGMLHIHQGKQGKMPKCNSSRNRREKNRKDA